MSLQLTAQAYGQLALSFAPEAVFSFAPCLCNVDTSPHPVRHASMLDERVEGSNGPSTNPRLKFVAQPAVVTALKHLHCGHITSPNFRGSGQEPRAS